MRNGTEQRRRERRKVWRSLLLLSAVRVAASVLLVWFYLQRRGDVRAAIILGAALLDLGMLADDWITFKTKQKETEGGEDDAAAQYGLYSRSGN